MNEIKQYGISVYQEEYVEGDDWCAMLSRKLVKNGTNCIIWSADRDLTQLVQTNNNGNFCVCWSPFSSRNKYGHSMKLFVDNSPNNFNLMNPNYMSNYNLLKKICNLAECIDRINPHDVIVYKIFFGDVSDNIFCPLKIQRKTRLQSIPKKTFDLNVDIDTDDTFVKVINENRSIYNNKLVNSDDEILEHLKYNRTLVTLDEKYYPKEIVDKLENSEEIRKFIDIDMLINKYNAENVETLNNNNNFTNILETI